MANKYLILLVEDESNIASFITTVLRANQYEVKRAATGEEALMTSVNTNLLRRRCKSRATTRSMIISMNWSAVRMRSVTIIW